MGRAFFDAFFIFALPRTTGLNTYPAKNSGSAINRLSSGNT
jgi:hypothetical protein